MPTHTAVGSDAATLETLVAAVERKKSERIVSVLQAGNKWMVVTVKVPATKVQTR